MVKNPDPDPDPVNEFCFRLGHVIGLFTNKKVKDFLRSRDVKDQELEDFKNAVVTIAESFYRGEDGKKELRESRVLEKHPEEAETSGLD